MTGHVRRPLELVLDELESSDSLSGVLDCTGGWYAVDGGWTAVDGRYDPPA